MSIYSQGGEDPMRNIAMVADNGGDKEHRVQPGTHARSHIPRRHEAVELADSPEVTGGRDKAADVAPVISR